MQRGRGQKRTTAAAGEALAGPKRTRSQSTAANRATTSTGGQPTRGRPRGRASDATRSRNASLAVGEDDIGVLPIAPPEMITQQDIAFPPSASRTTSGLQEGAALIAAATTGTIQPGPVNALETAPSSSTSGVGATSSAQDASNMYDAGVYLRTGTDPIGLFAESLQETLRVVRDAALSETDSRLGGRVQVAKELPIFAGNPLEWMHFEATYRSSTRLCQFSDRENISRLFKALRGQAREAVETLLSTASTAEPIMELLKLNFGNKRHLAERILRDVYDLPSLQSGKIDIARFATRLRNAVSSFKSLEMPEYINSIDLLRNVASKITEEKKSLFNRYKASDPGMTCLEKLSEFLYQEAEFAMNGGLLNLGTAALTVRNNDRDTNNVPRRQGRTQGNPITVFAASVQPGSASRMNEFGSVDTSCVVCKRDGHGIGDCSEFRNESFGRRRVIIGKAGLCYRCLGKNHVARECNKAVRCSICHRSHHTAMHISGDDKPTNRRDRDVRQQNKRPRQDENNLPAENKA